SSTGSSSHAGNGGSWCTSGGATSPASGSQPWRRRRTCPSPDGTASDLAHRGRARPGAAFGRCAELELLRPARSSVRLAPPEVTETTPLAGGALRQPSLADGLLYGYRRLGALRRRAGARSALARPGELRGRPGSAGSAHPRQL